MDRTVVVFWGAVGVAGAFLPGCGSSGAPKLDGGGIDGGGAGDSDAPKVVDGADSDAPTMDGGGAGNDCHDAMTKFCTRAQACTPGSFTLSGFTSVADCVSYFEPSCDDAVAAPHTGRTAALVRQCGDGWAAMSCTDFVQKRSVPACLPQGGTVAIGGSCNSDWQCASGVCWQPSTDSCGTCAAVTSVGQPSQVDASLGALCPDDLVCTQAVVGGGMLVCAAYVPTGGACIETEVCASNAYCDPTTNICTQLPAIGGACDSTNVSDCDPTQAAAACDGTTCTPVAAAADGQACGTVNGTDTRCNGACTDWDGTKGVCRTFLAQGQACTPAQICTVGTTCTGGVCTSPVCGGAGSSENDAAVTASAAPAAALDERRTLRWPGMPIGAALRR